MTKELDFESFGSEMKRCFDHADQRLSLLELRFDALVENLEQRLCRIEKSVQRLYRLEQRLERLERAARHCV